MDMAQKRERPAGTRANAEENTESIAIVEHAFADRKTISTVTARAARLGYMTRVTDLPGSRRIYAFERMGQSHVYGHAHDVDAFLARVGALQ